MRRTRVTFGLHAWVIDRDRRCFYAKVSQDHRCRDAYGREHASDDARSLTLDHVKDQPRMGRRAEDDEFHLVAMCGLMNNAVPSREIRGLERSYLAKIREDVEAGRRPGYDQASRSEEPR